MAHPTLKFVLLALISLYVCSASPVDVKPAPVPTEETILNAASQPDVSSDHAATNLNEVPAATDFVQPNESSASSAEHQDPSSPSTSETGKQQHDGEPIQVYVMDISSLPEPIASLVQRIPGLQYGQSAITYLHRVSNGLIPNAQLVQSSPIPSALDVSSVEAPLARSARSAVEERKLGLLVGKKLIGTKLIKGVLFAKLAAPIALKAGKVAALATLLPIKLAAKGALVGGLIAKPILLKSALVGGKVAKVGALVIGKPLLAGGLAKAGLATAGLATAGLLKAPKVAVAATKGGLIG